MTLRMPCRQSKQWGTLMVRLEFLMVSWSSLSQITIGRPCKWNKEMNIVCLLHNDGDALNQPLPFHRLSWRARGDAVVNILSGFELNELWCKQFSERKKLKWIQINSLSHFPRYNKHCKVSHLVFICQSLFEHFRQLNNLGWSLVTGL